MKRIVVPLLFSAFGAAVLTALAMAPFGGANAQSVDGLSGQVLAPLSRQAAWLNLEAPRPRFITRLNDPAYVTDVAALSGVRFAVLAISSPFAEHDVAGSDLFRLDTGTGELTPFLRRATAQESLTAPAWWPDGSGVLLERDDLTAPLPPYPGESTTRYRSRIDGVAPDGSGTAAFVTSGRMPAPSPDGNSVAVVETAGQGTGLVVWSRSDGSTITLVPAGEFADIAYPRFSPAGDRIAFLVPERFIGGNQRMPDAACSNWLFAACVALAHGLPWNLWLVNTDGTNAHELAGVESDDGSVAWSPDGSALFVYGGNGAFVVDAATGHYQLLSYLTGYGSIAWLSDQDGKVE